MSAVHPTPCPLPFLLQTYYTGAETRERKKECRRHAEPILHAICGHHLTPNERFRSWINREVHAEATGPPAVPIHLPLHKMKQQDGLEMFLELFEKSAEVCGWPHDQWPVRLIPLLLRESQVAAQQLPVANLLVFDNLKRAIIQRVGRTRAASPAVPFTRPGGIRSALRDGPATPGLLPQVVTVRGK